MELDRPRRRRRRRWPWLVAVVAALGLGGWALVREGVVQLPGEAPAPPVAPPLPPGSPPGTAAVPPPTVAAAPADESLPSVADSDHPVEEQAHALSTHPAFAGWLAQGTLLPRFVAAVDNVADGLSPRIQLSFLAPAAKFAVRQDHDRTFVDPAAYARYDVIGDVVASLDAGACARLYDAFRPLLESAYRELGRPDRTFDQTLALAIDRLLAVPVTDAPVELNPLVTRNEFADARLESFSPAEKHLLRMGPRNIRLVQAKLREIEAALRAQQ